MVTKKQSTSSALIFNINMMTLLEGTSIKFIIFFYFTHKFILEYNKKTVAFTKCWTYLNIIVLKTFYKKESYIFT